MRAKVEVIYRWPVVQSPKAEEVFFSGFIPYLKGYIVELMSRDEDGIKEKDVSVQVKERGRYDSLTADFEVVVTADEHPDRCDNLNRYSTELSHDLTQYIRGSGNQVGVTKSLVVGVFLMIAPLSSSQSTLDFRQLRAA